MRKAAIIIALVMAWASFGLVVHTMLSGEIQRCNAYRDLSAECFAPFALIFSIVCLVFVLATIVLAVLAWRTPKPSDQA